jgi:hypothetical protein
MDELFDGIDVTPSTNDLADVAEFDPDEFGSLLPPLPVPPKSGDPSPRNPDSPTPTDSV